MSLNLTLDQFWDEWTRAEYCESTARRDHIRAHLWLSHVGSHCPVLPGTRVTCIHIPGDKRITWSDPQSCDWSTVLHWRPVA